MVCDRGHTAPQCHLIRACRDGRRKLSLGCCYSADGRCRCRFVADRCSFAARRPRFDPRVGLVGRRWTAPGARPAVMSSASLPKAISRLRSWERCSEAVTVITPVMRRRPRRMASIVRCPSESAAEPAMFQESSTRLSEVFTCCPPGPDERENRQRSSDAGIVSAGDTSRSMQQALRDVTTGCGLLRSCRWHKRTDTRTTDPES